MGLYENLIKEAGTSKKTSLYENLIKEAELEKLADTKGTTVYGLEQAKYRDANASRKDQKLKELNSVPEPTSLENFNKKASETKWYEPKIGLVKDFLKLDTKDKKAVANQATEYMTNSDLYAVADAAADKAFIIPGLRPALQKAIFEKVPNGEDYLKKKQETAKVVAVGPGKKLDDGKIVASPVKVGDIILMDKYSGQEVNLQDEEYVIVKADDIIAIIEE